MPQGQHGPMGSAAPGHNAVSRKNNKPMSAHIARLKTDPAKPRPRRRKVERHAAWTKARLQSSYGDREDVTLCDLSTHGCCVRISENWLRTGSFVSIAIDSEPPLQAIVRWVRDGAAGLEFLRPVPDDRTEWLDLLDSSFFF